MPKNHNARAKLLFCSLNFLFGDVLVTVAVMFIVRSLIRQFDGDVSEMYRLENIKIAFGRICKTLNFARASRISKILPSLHD